MAQPDRAWDFLVFGATSFVGQLLCAYLDERLTDSPCRWAIAGRDPDKLRDVQSRLRAPVGVIVADANDVATLTAMVNQTNVVVSTVGPYALYGSRLVEAAVKAGTDYCDLTGEPQWMQRMIDTYGDTAVSTGARVVHACGFDSIPSDLGVSFLQRSAQSRFGETCPQVSMRVKALKGGVSGGTIASMLNLIEEAAQDGDARRLLANPYALAPVGMREGVAQPNVLAPVHDEASASWVAPFVMATVNTRIVHRTHALRGRPWGEDFLYDEATITGSGAAGLARASALAGGVGGFAAVSSLGPLRRLLERHVLPKPGDGPTPQVQHDGFFDLRFYGTTAGGERITAKVSGDRDPGYGSTAKMLGEATLCLAMADPAELPGGFWTPATAFGSALTGRLVEHAGMQFSILD